MAAVIDYLDSLEIGICLRVNRLSRRDYVRRFFAIVSRLGDGGYWMLPGLVLINIHGTAVLTDLMRIALTAGVGVLIYKCLKKRLVRNRPFIANGGIACGCAPLDKYSFPSGHTLHAVSFTIMFAAVEPALLVLTAPMAILIALSRVILGLHYPSDVLVGGAIGTLLALISNSLI